MIRRCIGDEHGQTILAAVLLMVIIILIAGGAVDLYRLQEARSWAYRTAEVAALAGATLGRDLSAVYTAGPPRVDPDTGHAAAEQAVLEALARRGVTGATCDIRVIEWGGETIPNYPPVARADMWGASAWTSAEPAVGVYLAVPVETFLLGLVNGSGPVTVHAFAAAGVASP